MPPFHLLPATPADCLPIVTECAAPAFDTDALRLATFPPSLVDPANPNAYLDWRIARMQKRMAGGQAVLKVVDDETGKIAGFANWARPKPNGVEEKKKKDEAKDKDEDMACPPCANKEAYDALMKCMADAKTRAVGEDTNVWYLSGIATSPAFQRQGVAASLVQWGIDQSERDGVLIYLEATPAGEPLYRKMGFETVGEVDLTHILPKGVDYGISIMVRKPRGGRAEDEDQ